MIKLRQEVLWETGQGLFPTILLHSRHCTRMCRCREAQGSARTAIPGGQSRVCCRVGIAHHRHTLFYIGGQPLPKVLVLVACAMRTIY